MFGIKQKSYGQRYQSAKVKVKLSKRKVLLMVILFLILAEVVLGVLWALGF